MDKIKLLIVDDEPRITEAIKGLIGQKDHISFIANNGNEALEILAKEQIDCVVSDIYMPDMDGMELAENIRKVGLDIPIIFFTAYGSEDLIRKSLELKAYGFVSKPDFDELCDAIQECIQVM